MAHFNLPELDQEKVRIQDTGVGKWTNNERDVLSNISDGIVISAATHGVSSIPDIWARPLTFFSALKSASHPLHKIIKQEWRGLISVLALHKLKGIRGITFSAVSLDNDPETKDKFSKALFNLEPLPVSLQENAPPYKWSDIILIKYNDIALGAFSPTTLIYTGSDYADRLNSITGFPFKDDNGLLKAPTNDLDLEYLGEWLFYFKTEFERIDNDQDPIAQQYTGLIKNLISEWYDEIKKRLIAIGRIQNAVDVDADDAEITQVASEVQNSEANEASSYGIYQLLLKPLKEIVNANERRSNCGLEYKRNNTNYSEIVVIHPSLITDNVLIWKKQSPIELGLRDGIQTLLGSKSSGNVIATLNLQLDNAIWIRPEKYFLTDTLLKADKGDALCATETEFNKSTKFLLPFRKEILNFFNPSEINEILRPTYDETENSVIFSFRIPIVNNKFVEVKKTYKYKGIVDGEGAINSTQIPLLDIFPKYLGESWHRYYFIQNRCNLFQANLLFTNLNALNVKPKEFDYRNVDDKGVLLDSDKICLTQISGDNSYPEAIELVDKERSVPTSVILIRKDDYNNTGGIESAKVGIDFGTSNTNVYWIDDGNANGANMKPLNFQFTNYHRFISFNNTPRENEILERYLLPYRDITLPKPTALKVYDNAQFDSKFLDYFIFYPKPSEYQLPENVYINIKWNGKSEHVTSYFKSLLFVVLVETAIRKIKNIKLFFSYPKAFDEDARLAQQGLWTTAIDALTKDTGRVISFESELDAPKFETEGKAAGKYFSKTQNADFPIDDMAIAVDVGGGTTDISLWCDKDVKYDTSIKLAGADISKIFTQNRKLASVLFNENAVNVLFPKDGSSNPNLHNAFLNLILKNEEELIKKNLIKYTQDENVKWLRQIITLIFGSISYYIGEICLSIGREEDLIIETIKLKRTQIAWGGNAAKLIAWIDNGTITTQGISSFMLNAIFYNCLKGNSIKPNSINQIHSANHKAEAAGGLVVELELGSNKGNSNGGSPYDIYDTDNIDSNKKLVVCGEDIPQKNGSVISYLDLIETKSFDNMDLDFGKFQTTQLNKYLEIYNSLGINKGLLKTSIVLTSDESLKIKTTVESYIKSNHGITEDKRSVEPIFIIEMKALLEILISRRAK